MRRAGLVSEQRLDRARNRFGSADYRAAEGVMRSVLVEAVGESYEAELVAELPRSAGVGRGRHRGAGVGRPERRRHAGGRGIDVTLEVVPGAGHHLADNPSGGAPLDSRRSPPVIAWLLVPAAAGAVLSAACWLRVAQREHYLAGSATRFAIRWWRVPPVNLVLFVIGISAGIAAFWWPAAGIGAMLAGAIGPVGPGRGRTSPLRWTACAVSPC